MCIRDRYKGGAVRSLTIRAQHAPWLLNRWEAGFDETAMNQVVDGGVSGHSTKTQRAREAVCTSCGNQYTACADVRLAYVGPQTKANRHPDGLIAQPEAA